MGQCLVCNHTLQPFLDLGTQPSANKLLKASELDQPEFTYQLKVGFCEKCFNVQTLDRPAKEQMFQENYAYYSSTSLPMVEHFKNTASILKDRFNDEDFFIVEVGSNDGVFLQNFKDGPHLGIEPSGNVAKVAKEKGIECWNDFFHKETAQNIINEQGKANIIFAANVFGHVEALNSIVEGIKLLLKERGVFSFEIYYLPEMIKRNSFDLIYDEHLFFYTLSSLQNLFAKQDLELFDVDMIPVHGGSIRGYVSHTGAYPKSNKFREALQQEEENGFGTLKPLQEFSHNVSKVKEDLLSLLTELKTQGKKIAGYGATAKSTTVLNYCDIDKDAVDFIVDNTPFKQGKYTPGKHIPIIPEEEFLKNPPDYTILFAWNYADTIMAKQKAYNENGGKWILIHPEVQVL